MHKHFWHIIVLVEGGIVLTVTLLRENYDSFKKVLAHFEGNYARIVYDARPLNNSKNQQTSHLLTRFYKNCH